MKKKTRIMAAFMAVLMMCTAFICPQLFQNKETSTAEAYIPTPGTSGWAYSVKELAQSDSTTPYYNSSTSTSIAGYLPQAESFRVVGTTNSRYKILFSSGTYKYVKVSDADDLITWTYTGYIVPRTTVNIRRWCDSSVTSLGTVYTGQAYAAYGYATDIETGVKWYKILTNDGRCGWVASGISSDIDSYITHYAHSGSVGSYTRTITVDTDTNIRLSASTSGTKVYNTGSSTATFEYTGISSVTSSGARWYKIVFHDYLYAWVSADYATIN